MQDKTVKRDENFVNLSFSNTSIRGADLAKARCVPLRCRKKFERKIGLKIACGWLPKSR